MKALRHSMARWGIVVVLLAGVAGCTADDVLQTLYNSARNSCGHLASNCDVPDDRW